MVFCSTIEAFSVDLLICCFFSDNEVFSEDLVMLFRFPVESTRAPTAAVLRRFLLVVASVVFDAVGRKLRRLVNRDALRGIFFADALGESIRIDDRLTLRNATFLMELGETQGPSRDLLLLPLRRLHATPSSAAALAEGSHCR